MKDNPDGALERARRDLSSGRPDLARDRVTGFLYTLHRRGEYDQSAYLLLGDIYFEMHDYPRAGAAWLLTERRDAHSARAIEAFHKRYGKDATNVLKVIKPHAPSENYPPQVQERLRGLGYQYVAYRPRSNPHVMNELTAEEIAGASGGLRPLELGCLLMFILGAVLIILQFGMRFLGR